MVVQTVLLIFPFLQSIINLRCGQVEVKEVLNHTHHPQHPLFLHCFTNVQNLPFLQNPSHCSRHAVPRFPHGSLNLSCSEVYIILFIFLLMFVLLRCGRLSWLPVSFQSYIKSTACRLYQNSVQSTAKVSYRCKQTNISFEALVTQQVSIKTQNFSAFSHSGRIRNFG